MSYLSVIYGVKGLFFYTGSGQRDYQGRPSGILNKMEEGNWEYVKKLVRELRDLSPLIMAPKPAADIRRLPSDAPVDFALRDYQGKLYLIAASRSSVPSQVRFEGNGLAGMGVRDHFESRTLHIRYGAFEDAFGPYGVHLYEISR